MKSIVLLIMCATSITQAHVGTYLLSALNQYRATRAYQRDDFNAAQQLLERGLVDYPHDSKLNYNLGCAYHKQKKEEQAQECFKRAVDASDMHLKEHAYFNMANSYVALEKLDDAIAAYEQVLALNQNNEQAKHNLEMIKKRKQEQQQQKQKDDKKKDQKDDKQDNQDKNQNSENNQQDSQQGDNPQNKDSQDNNSSDDKQNKDEKNKDKDQQSKPQPQDADQQNKQPDKNKDQQGSSGQDNRQQQEKKQQQGAPGDERKNELQDKSVNAKYDKHAGNEKLDKHLQLVLMQAEKNDEEQYKKMIKAHVKKEMPAQPGQKNG